MVSNRNGTNLIHYLSHFYQQLYKQSVLTPEHITEQRVIKNMDLGDIPEELEVYYKWWARIITNQFDEKFYLYQTMKHSERAIV